jgi:DNA-binding SARP family transcriptional activator
MSTHSHPVAARLPEPPPTRRAEIHLLGRFDVTVDGAVTPGDRWTRRPAAALVKLLALTPGHRLHREQVMDVLWPDDAPGAAAPKLHKAAYFARRATGRDDTIVLRNDVVHLFPAAELAVDVVAFDDLSRRAIGDGDPAVARAAIEHYAGDLLPDDPYEEWVAERRELLRLRHLNVLRLAGRWMAVTEQEPGDEDAHVELMRAHLAAGDCDAALLQYERLERTLQRDLGVAPGAAARTLRARIDDGECTPPTPLHGPRVDELVAELAELNRRQARLLERLAAAGSPIPLTARGAA